MSAGVIVRRADCCPQPMLVQIRSDPDQVRSFHSDQIQAESDHSTLIRSRPNQIIFHSDQPRCRLICICLCYKGHVHHADGDLPIARVLGCHLSTQCCQSGLLGWLRQLGVVGWLRQLVTGLNPPPLRQQSSLASRTACAVGAGRAHAAAPSPLSHHGAMECWGT